MNEDESEQGEGVAQLQSRRNQETGPLGVAGLGENPGRMAGFQWSLDTL